MEIEVVPHDPSWVVQFESEAAIWRRLLVPSLVGIHHIGSTAVPAIYAKPIIDILVEVTDLRAVDERVAMVEAAGYEAMGEFGIAGRRYFRKDDDRGIRRFQTHVFSAGSADIERHLAFRDYLRSHPSVASEYSRLKRSLAKQCGHDREAYIKGKDPFIKTQEHLALRWRRSA